MSGKEEVWVFGIKESPPVGWAIEYNVAGPRTTENVKMKIFASSESPLWRTKPVSRAESVQTANVRILE